MIQFFNNNIKNIAKFTEAEVGETYNMTLLLISIAEGTAKNGNPFVTLRFMDGTSIAEAKMFNTAKIDLVTMGISEVSVVVVTIEVSDYAGKSYNVRDIASNSDPNLSINDFIVHAPVDEETMFSEIVDILQNSHTDNGTGYIPLFYLAISILEKYKEAFTTSSAALVVHHNYKGGLIYHSYRMAKAADALTNIYTGLNKEVVICGAVLHDIGKIMEYNTSDLGEAEMTELGVLFGHPFCGALVVKCMSSGKNYNPEEVRLLIHILLSHHGKGDYGAAVAPAIPEAFAVHHIDNMDAKIAQCEANYSEMESGTITERRPFTFDNRLYKPNIYNVF